MSELRPTRPLAALRTRIRDFFYAEEVPYGLALVRICLPMAMLLPMLQRWPWVRELYSTDGAVVQLSQVYGFSNWMPEVPGSMAIALFSAMIFFLVCSSIGWMTRISLIGATVLFTYFNMLDAVSTITKYSVIAIDAMIVLSLSNCGSLWSVDSWRARAGRRSTWPGEPAIVRQRFPVWQARLLQLLTGCVYFGAAVTKIQTQAFFSGDQLRYWMLTNVNFGNPVGEYMAMMPALLIVSAYVTIVWEMLFIFTVWRGWQRVLMLAMGIGFHFMTSLTLGLIVFPLVCISVYFAFLRESDVQWIAAKYRRLRRRRGRAVAKPAPAAVQTAHAATAPRRRWPAFLQVPQQVVYAGAVVLIAIVSVEAEYRIDPYGHRNSGGPMPLREIDAETAQMMLQPTSPLREQDKVFSFDIGTFSVGGILANTRREFEYGEIILAQCSLNPPREDLLVECDIVDSEDRLIHHFQAFATREMMRCDFYYRIGNALVPGHYFVVLKSSGKEVGRRPFYLDGDPNSIAMPLAN